MPPPGRLVPNSVCRLLSLGSDPAVARRLTQMGLLPGTEVTVIRTGPLGGPVELATEDGQSIALRTEQIRTLACDLIAQPLTAIAVAAGGRYRVRALLGGEGYRQKMAARGIAPDVRFTLARMRPLMLALQPDGPEVTIGRGEAEKLLVEPLGE